MGDMNPGQDEEAAVIDEEGKVGLAGGVTPADPGVARSHLPGGAGEQQAGQEGTGRS